MNLFQITEESATEYRIHFIGYSKAWDQWIGKSDVILRSSQRVAETPVDIKASVFCKNLQVEIKHKLDSSRKNDPKVVLYVDCDPDVFEHLFGEKRRRIRISNTVLSGIFDKDWDTRCLNKLGDYCFVTDNTIELSLTKHRPLLEFVKGWDGELHEHQIHRGHFLTFGFVRGDAKRYTGTMHM